MYFNGSTDRNLEELGYLGKLNQLDENRLKNGSFETG